jgi:zinc/manganese transport system substrate-binding protein
MRCFPMRALLVLFSLLLPLSMAQAADKLQVVTSFSILADITHQIGGDHIQISNMVGPDADAHTYEPTPDDAKTLLKAKLIIKNGLGFEPWLDRLVSSTETKATVVTASKGVISHTMDEDGETIPDPHTWHNLANAEIYVNNITKALVTADPANQADYLRNSQAYLKEIHRVLAEAKTRFGALPSGNRRIVTSHDAFGYLGQAYGIQFLAPQGLSTEREPSRPCSWRTSRTHACSSKLPTKAARRSAARCTPTPSPPKARPARLSGCSNTTSIPCARLWAHHDSQCLMVLRQARGLTVPQSFPSHCA